MTKINCKVTLKNALLKQCHECLGGYRDGRVDCENVRCSLYPFMPYAKLEPDLEWTTINPKRVGDKPFAEKRKLTPEQLEHMKKMSAARAIKKYEDSIETDKHMIEDDILNSEDDHEV